MHSFLPPYHLSHFSLSLCLLRPQIVDIGLEDPVAEKKGENLGFLRLFIRVSFDIEEDSIAPQCSRKSSGKERGAHLWSKVLNVTLLEGKGLPAMDDNGERTTHALRQEVCSAQASKEYAYIFLKTMFSVPLTHSPLWS